MNSEAKIIQQKLTGEASLRRAAGNPIVSSREASRKEQKNQQNNNITSRAYKYIQTNWGSH